MLGSAAVSPRNAAVIKGLVCAAGLLVAFDDIGPLRHLAGTFGASLAWVPLLACGLLLPRSPRSRSADGLVGGRPRLWSRLLIALWVVGAAVTLMTFVVLPATTRGVNLYMKALAVGIPIAVFLCLMVVGARLAAYQPALITLFGLVSLGTLLVFGLFDIVGILPRTGEWFLHGQENGNERARGSRYEASALGAGLLVALATVAIRLRGRRPALAVGGAALCLALLIPSRGTLVVGVVFVAAALVVVLLHRRLADRGRQAGLALAGGLIFLTLLGGFGLGQLVSAPQWGGMSYSTSDAVRSVWSDVGLEVALDHPAGMGYSAPLEWLPTYVRASIDQYDSHFAPADFGELFEQLDAEGGYGFSPKTMPSLVGVYFGALGVILLLVMWGAIGRRLGEAWQRDYVAAGPASIAVCLVSATFFSSIYAWEQAVFLGVLLGSRDLWRREPARFAVPDRVAALTPRIRSRRPTETAGPAAAPAVPAESAVGPAASAVGPASPRRAAAWVAIGLASSQLARLGIAIVLARILGPENFAPIAAAAVLMSFVALGIDLGLVAAIIQRRTLTEAHLRAAALMSLACGIVFALGIVAACLAGLAGPVGSATMLFFLALAAAPLIRSIGLVSQSRLYRQRRQHLVGIAEAGVGALSVLACAVSLLLGAGMFSYVVAILVTEVTLAALWVLLARPFRPPGWHRDSFRELWSFSSKSFGSDALSVTTRNMDSILVGSIAGAAQLSVYSVGARFLLAPVQFLGEVIVRVALPEFSESNRTGVPIGPALLHWTRLVSGAIWPALVAAFFVAPWLVPALLGPEWTAAVVVTQVLCLVGALQVAQGFIRPAMVSVGAVKLQLLLNVGICVVSFVTYLALARYGALAVALGYAAIAGVVTPVIALAGSATLDVPAVRTVAAIFSGLPAALTVGVPALLVGLVLRGSAHRVPAQAVTAVVVLVLALAVTHRDTIRRIARTAPHRHSPAGGADDVTRARKGPTGLPADGA